MKWANLLKIHFCIRIQEPPWRVGRVPTQNARLSAHSIIPNFYCHFCHYRDCDGGAVRLIGSQRRVFKNVIRRRLRISCVLPSSSRRHCGSHASYPARDENWISHLKADIHSFLSIINLLAPPERGAHDFQRDEGRSFRRLHNVLTLPAESIQCLLLALIDSKSFLDTKIDNTSIRKVKYNLSLSLSPIILFAWGLHHFCTQPGFLNIII